jgi:hypothetical protein
MSLKVPQKAAASPNDSFLKRPRCEYLDLGTSSQAIRRDNGWESFLFVIYTEVKAPGCPSQGTWDSASRIATGENGQKQIRVGKQRGNMAEKSSSSKTEQPQANGSKVEAIRPSADVQLANILVLLERAVKSKDTKLLVGRLLRQTASIRAQLQPEVLTAFLEEAFPADHPTRTFLLGQLNKVTLPRSANTSPNNYR